MKFEPIGIFHSSKKNPYEAARQASADEGHSEGVIELANGKNFEQALTEGEDFELLFTLSPKEAARLGAYSFKEKMVAFHPIGRVVGKKFGVRLVRDDGKSELLSKKGFDHFK